MSNRNTVPLLLPDCQATVYLYEFMVSGDFRRLQRKMLDSVKMKMNVKNNDPKQLPEINEVPGSIMMDDDEEAVKIMVERIVTVEGTTVGNKDDYIYNLSVADGDLLFEKVKEITNASRLTPAAKKK